MAHWWSPASALKCSVRSWLLQLPFSTCAPKTLDYSPQDWPGWRTLSAPAWILKEIKPSATVQSVSLIWDPLLVLSNGFPKKYQPFALRSQRWLCRARSRHLGPKCLDKCFRQPTASLRSLTSNRGRSYHDKGLQSAIWIRHIRVFYRLHTLPCTCLS